MTIIEQARQLLASLEALSMPDTQIAALCRALIVRTDALERLCEGWTPGTPYHEYQDRVYAARRALADEPHTGHD